MDLTGNVRDGYLARLPCVTTRLSKNQTTCDKFRPYTSKEAKEEYEMFEEKLRNVTRN